MSVLAPDLAFMQIAGFCGERGCGRYAAGERCERHGGEPEPLPRYWTDDEMIATHEAAHVVVGRAVDGFEMTNATILPNDTSLGSCKWFDRGVDVSSFLAMSLAGCVAEQLLMREDWRDLALHLVHAREDKAGVAEQALRLHLIEQGHSERDADRAAFIWVDDAMKRAGERAHEVLVEQWADVIYEAARLLRNREVRYGAA